MQAYGSGTGRAGERWDSVDLSAPAVELLATLVNRAGVDRRRRREQPAALAELQQAGLLSADAFLTGRGRRMVEPWRLADRRLALGTRSPGAGTRTAVWAADGAALLHSATESSRGQEELSVLPLASLVPALAHRTASLTTGPGTTLAPGEHQVLLLEDREYENRINGARLPVPEGAGAQVLGLLESDWTECTLANESWGGRFTWITAEGAGIFAVDFLPDGSTALEPMAATTHQDILMCLVYAVPEQSGSGPKPRPGAAAGKQLRQQRGH